jgi:hypothetical protein
MIHLIIAVVVLIGTVYFIISIVVLACRVVWLCVLIVAECLLISAVTVLAMALGAQKLYQFLDTRPKVEILPPDWPDTWTNRFDS